MCLNVLQTNFKKGVNQMEDNKELKPEEFSEETVVEEVAMAENDETPAEEKEEIVCAEEQEAPAEETPVAEEMAETPAEEEAMACGEEEKLADETTTEEETLAEVEEPRAEESSETFAEGTSEQAEVETEVDFAEESTIVETRELSFMESIDSDLIENHKEFAEAIKDLDCSQLFVKFAEIFAQNVELSKEHDAIVKEKTEKAFEQIMDEVKGDLTEERFAELYAEGKELKMEELNGFANKVKAFAFDERKIAKKDNKTDDDIVMDVVRTNVKNYDESDVFARLANK